MKPSLVRCVVAFVFAMACGWAASANGFTLEYVGSFEPDSDADGIAFHPVSGTVFVINDSDVLFEYQVDGTPLGSVSTGIHDLQGIDVLPNGNFLVAEDEFSGNTRVVELDASEAVVGGGIDIDVSGVVEDNKGVVFDAGTGSVFVLDDSDDEIYRYSSAGVLQATIDIGVLGVTRAQGIAIDPQTGHLLIGNQRDVVIPGNVYEVTASGALVSTIDLSVLTGLSLNSPVGLSVGGGRLYAGQGAVERVDIFDIVETGGVPEPGTGVLCVGVLGIVASRPRSSRI